ncbi:hypothetical protein SAMN05192534_11924 [Alteribacillus persepolensis]|uniref:Uncharacterized protein n=1 Tax=Alteribacillus persepolensis TaxID=568899 RepID=A0A1G8HAR7_9BACI|nr:hypothetical protein [Alteribacillus persepolensis]SDI03737.1 hypothetical protein SAMN05192534_11924 [Alteribacillus persepolensis]
MGCDQACSACKSSNVWVMSPLRYIFFMSVLPVLAAVLFAVIIHAGFVLFIPAVILTNHMLSKKKAPLVVCRDCKHTAAQPKGKSHYSSAL